MKKHIYNIIICYNIYAILLIIDNKILHLFDLMNDERYWHFFMYDAPNSFFFKIVVLHVHYVQPKKII